MYVTDNYDLSLLYLHVELFLHVHGFTAMCFSCLAYSTHAQSCSRTSCLLQQQRELCCCH